MALYEDPGQPQETADLHQAVALTSPPRYEFAATAQEDHLARVYALFADPARAYKEAGYPPLGSKASTRTAAFTLLGKRRLQERVEHYRKLQQVKLDVREDRLLAEIAAVAMSDPLDFLDPVTYKPLPLNEMPQHARAALKSINVKVREEVDEDGTVTSETDSVIQLWDKMKALDMAARVKGLYMEDEAAKVPTVVIDMRAMAALASPAVQTPTAPTAPTAPLARAPEEGTPEGSEKPVPQPEIVFDFMG